MAHSRQCQFFWGLLQAVLAIDIAKASKCSDICKPLLNTSLPCPLRPKGEDPPVLACANDELRDSQHYRTGSRVTSCNSGNIQSVNTLNGCKMWKCNPGFKMNLATGSLGWVTVADYAECLLNRMFRLNGADAFYNWEVSCVPTVTYASKVAPKRGANSECVDEPKGAKCSCVAGYREGNGSCVEDSEQEPERCSCPYVVASDGNGVCPIGSFCYAPTNDNCKITCNGADALFQNMEGSTTAPTKVEGVPTCGLDKTWTPMISGTAYCVKPATSLPTEPTPTLAECPKIPMLALKNGVYEDIHYLLDSATSTYTATCATGVLYTLKAGMLANIAPATAFASCQPGGSGWKNNINFEDVAMATFTSDVDFACGACRDAGTTDMVPIDAAHIKFVTSAGACYAQCVNAAQSLSYTVDWSCTGSLSTYNKTTTATTSPSSTTNTTSSTNTTTLPPSPSLEDCGTPIPNCEDKSNIRCGDPTLCHFWNTHELVFTAGILFCPRMCGNCHRIYEKERAG